LENQSKSSSKNYEESASNNESQITEVDEGTPKKVRLGGYLTKSNSIVEKDEKDEILFGQETVKQANELIDFAVKTKKAIDKFD